MRRMDEIAGLKTGKYTVLRTFSECYEVRAAEFRIVTRKFSRRSEGGAEKVRKTVMSAV